MSTLNYAAKASLISNLPTKNIDPRLMEINDQKKKIFELEKELRSANEHIQFITQMNDEKSLRIMQLEHQLRQYSQQTLESNQASTLPHINMRALKSEIPKEDLLQLNGQEISSGFNSQLTKDNERPVISPTRPQRGDSLKQSTILTSQQQRR